VPGYAYDRLSQLDHSFLLYEGPSDHMHVAAVGIFETGPLATPEGGVDIERLRGYVASRLHAIPRYRQRLARVPWLDHPVWVDDDRFNLHYHVRHSRLPRPGDERQLKRMCGRILSQQLDRGKPLWEMWVIEGLEGDRFAVLTKTHHAMIDGVAGADLLAVLMRPDASDEIEPAPAWVPRPAPPGARLLVDELWRRARLPVELGETLWRLARDEDHARHDLAERLRATARVVARASWQASNTPLNQRVGPHRRWDWFALPLDTLRPVRRELGGTLNDLVLATVAGGVRRFLERRGVGTPGLDFRVMAPVSLRPRDAFEVSGNRVSAWLVPLPLDEPDPVRRLERIRETTAGLKARHEALGAETLTRLPEWTGSTLLSLGARLMTWAQPFNLVVTNVPGPQEPLYLLGSPMREIHPAVPLMGNLSVGIALFSYAGTISWGITADWDLVPDLHDLLLALRDAFGELQEAAEKRRAARSAHPGAGVGLSGVSAAAEPSGPGDAPPAPGASTPDEGLGDGG